MAEREMLTQERVQQIVDGSRVDPNGYEFAQLARLALKQFEARALIVQTNKTLERQKEAWNNVLELNLIPSQHRTTTEILRDEIYEALTAADAWLKENP